MAVIKATRWSGADWADEKRPITIIGIGGIGSWTALNLARIGHGLLLVDGDIVDDTNVSGGQMFRLRDVGTYKVDAVQDICREFGCTDNNILPIAEMYNKQTFDNSDYGDITICGLDNMAARKEIFEDWVRRAKYSELFIDGRLTMEMNEIFCIQKDKIEQIKEYREKHLFSDEEANLVDCTTKQSTFGAMNIASLITASVCNFLTNKKLETDLREVPFYQRTYLPIFQQVINDNICIEENLEEV